MGEGKRSSPQTTSVARYMILPNSNMPSYQVPRYYIYVCTAAKPDLSTLYIKIDKQCLQSTRGLCQPELPRAWSRVHALLLFWEAREFLGGSRGSRINCEREESNLIYYYYYSLGFNTDPIARHMLIQLMSRR